MVGSADIELAEIRCAGMTEELAVSGEQGEGTPGFGGRGEREG